MDQFKKYLDTKGGQLSSNQDLLKYFALPYIDNPTQHESFRGIFIPEWIEDMRQSIEEFSHSKIVDGDQPILMKIIQTYENQEENNAEELIQQVETLKS